MELVNQNCNNCKGLSGCTTYCSYHAAKALIDFIDRVDTVETKIGDFSSREKGGYSDLVVSGHQMWSLSDQSWLLTDISTSMDITSKFNTLNGKNPLLLISNYASKFGIPKQEATEWADKINKLNKNRLLILPIKPGTPCNLDTDMDGRQIKKKECNVAYIKWTTNKENCKLECTVGFQYEAATGKTTVKLPLHTYIDKFKMSSIEMQGKTEKHDPSVIQMTDYGIIRPIEVTYGAVKMAIDGSYMYCSINDELHIVGYWDNNGNLVSTIKSKSKAYDKIKDNINYIKSHRKYMAPYLLYDANEIVIE